MTTFEKWFMKRIIKKEVRQGYDHDKRITAMYGMLMDAMRDEFTEDNIPTLNYNATEWFNNALLKSHSIDK